jgi:7-cyano-7-deazaguanine synthase
MTALLAAALVAQPEQSTEPKMIPKTIVHLLSGGLDSVTMLYDLVGQGHFVHCVLFDYHQQHAQELTFAKVHCHRLNVMFTTVELPRLGGLTDGDWVVPFRNPIMLSIAVNIAVQAKADTVCIACNRDDREAFKDCQWAVIDALQHAVTLSGYQVELCAPYIDKRKWEILDLAKTFGIQMHETWSCYKGGTKPCGECPACLKLSEAMEHK